MPRRRSSRRGACEPSTQDALDLEAELERAELADLVERALARLPATSGEVLRQRYLQEPSVGEIAAQTGSTPDAISMR